MAAFKKEMKEHWLEIAKTAVPKKEPVKKVAKKAPAKKTVKKVMSKEENTEKTS